MNNKYTELLSNEFIANYSEFPEHMNALGKFVFYRTYSRFLPEKGRRETWKETCRRSAEYNVGLGLKHAEDLGYPVDYDQYRKEAEELFESQFNLRQFLSGRTLWVGGADGGVANKYPLANFNCSFVNIRSWDDLGDLFYLLLVGTGVGYKSTKEFAAALPPVRADVDIIHEPFTQRYPIVKQPDTQMFILEEKQKAVIHVGDSKEGWVDSLRTFFRLLTDKQYENINSIGIYYDYIRPKGARLNTFGGTASGYEPLKEMFEGIASVFRNEIDPSLAPLEDAGNGYKKVRPIHILDIGNLIGNNVVVGGVRRTAEIFLMDADDYESIFAKYGLNGIWDEVKHKEVIAKAKAVKLDGIVKMLEALPLFDPNARPLHHRRMSNNSVAFIEKPARKVLNLIYTMMIAEGEPGFINLEAAAKRRLAGMGIKNPSRRQILETAIMIGLNPCAEILLWTYGVCNLTTVNIVQFVKQDEHGYYLDVNALLEAQRLSARAGLRMTLATLEIPHWNETQSRDRLLGTSLTGVKDALAMIDYTEQEEAHLLELLGNTAREEADRYAKELRVTSPLLVTTVKPEGTLSQVAGGVSSGLHWSHSPYYIRRIRINAADPLAKAVKDIGWTIHAEVGTPGDTEEEKLANARTLVIDFPIASGASVTKDDVSAREQFDTYFRFQRHYTEHNSSNTIHVRPNEWAEAEQIVWDGWDEFTAVSFLAYDGGSYQLAPYEAITKEQYEEMAAKLTEFNPDILKQYETGDDSDLEGMDGCEGGVCPIR
jgi:ribonucleoside-triphosphate reductase